MHHILCGSPFIPSDFYAIRPLNESLYGIFRGHIFLLIWGGVGVVRIILRIAGRTAAFPKTAPLPDPLPAVPPAIPSFPALSPALLGTWAFSAL